MSDTIVALATTLGRSGIGVVRVSGLDAAAIAAKMSGVDAASFTPNKATLKRLTDAATGEAIDDAVITYFKAPRSFTGEDVVEISCHGSPVVLRQVIDECLRLGARMAEPGEFSLRALANGRIDLAEAEAIRDLIDAQTTASARQAVRQLRGEFSHQLQPIKDDLLDVIVVLESALEFVEDDLPEAQTEDIKRRLHEIIDAVEKMAATFKAGKLLREGLRVALIGKPNVGKSSLFNAMLGTDRAIVTDIAGTTRDQLHERLTIGDIPISLIDTAGLRETTDTVESIGVERSRQTMADADVVLVLLDAAEPLTDEDRDILHSVTDIDHTLILNKIDKLNQSGERQFDAANLATRVVEVSAKTGDGIDALKQAIIEPFAMNNNDAAGFLVSDARHHDLLVRAKDELENSLELIEQNASEEFTLVGLHNALKYLGQITGETTTEDMLTRIFSTFCIGK